MYAILLVEAVYAILLVDCVCYCISRLCMLFY